MSHLKLPSLKKTNEEGFTLVELLVVILIIGILTAIAIPAFLNQRRSAVDAMVESDIKSASIAVETYFVKNQNATSINLSEIQKVMTKSEGVVLHFSGGKDDFCIIGSHPNSDHYRGWGNDPIPGVRPYVLYQSKNGGTRDKKTTHAALTCNTNLSSWM